MDTPSIIFYEHSFEDPIKVSLVKSVLNLGNECRTLAEAYLRLKHEAVHAAVQLGEQSAEIAHLKAEVESLRKAGDNLVFVASEHPVAEPFVKAWFAAKEGKPSV